MKSLVLIALVALGTVSCGPVAISDNNIGDIITVGMNVNANVQSEVNANIANIIAAILINLGDQNLPAPPPPGPPGPPGPPEWKTTTPAPPAPTTPPVFPTPPPFPIPPWEMSADDLAGAIQEIRQKTANLSKEQKEQLWRNHAEEFVRKMMANKH